MVEKERTRGKESHLPDMRAILICICLAIAAPSFASQVDTYRGKALGVQSKEAVKRSSVSVSRGKALAVINRKNKEIKRSVSLGRLKQDLKELKVKPEK